MSPTLRQKAQLYHQLHVGFKSGLQLDQILRSDVLPSAYAKFGDQLGNNLRAGKTLASSLRGAKISAKWETRLLAIGEGNGQLESVLADLAAYYEGRSRQLGALKTKLVYPFLVLLIAIVVQPLPALAAGTLSVNAYLTGVTLRLLLVYATYMFCFVLPFERASSSAFNPVLIFSLRWLGNTHWLQLQFEIAYLNLLTLCLASGLDAVTSLKLLQECVMNHDYRSRHTAAINLVERTGTSLTNALSASGLIRHPMVRSFLYVNEPSGTLHSDLRQFVLRMKEETARTANHFVKQLGLGLYLLGLGILLAAYV
jgi:type II secretory pathway component PulF